MRASDTTDGRAGRPVINASLMARRPTADVPPGRTGGSALGPLTSITLIRVLFLEAH